MNKKSNFSLRLNEALRNKNMSKGELSKITKISETVIRRYISGDIEPGQEKVQLIAKAVGVSEEWLMGLDTASTDEDSKVIKTDFEPLTLKTDDFGRIIIPKSLRKFVGITTGDELTITVLADKKIIIEKASNTNIKGE